MNNTICDIKIDKIDRAEGVKITPIASKFSGMKKAYYPVSVPYVSCVDRYDLARVEAPLCC